MKQPMKVLLSLLILLQISNADDLIFSVYPSKSKESIYTHYQPLIEHLQKNLPHTITLSIAKDYSTQIDLLSNNKVHIAVLGPYNYVKAKSVDKNIQYLATQQYFNKEKALSSYQSVIVALKQSNIQSINQLKDKRFGFTDFNSTSGYLMPTVILQKHELSKEDFSEYFMLKKHSNIMEAITKKSIHAGATHYDNYKYYMKKYGDIYTLLYISEEIPFDAIVVSPGIKKALKQKIQEVFLSYKIKHGNQKINGYIKKDERVYDVVRLKANKLQ